MEESCNEDFHPSTWICGADLQTSRSLWQLYRPVGFHWSGPGKEPPAKGLRGWWGAGPRLRGSAPPDNTQGNFSALGNRATNCSGSGREKRGRRGCGWSLGFLRQPRVQQREPLPGGLGTTPERLCCQSSPALGSSPSQEAGCGRVHWAGRLASPRALSLWGPCLSVVSCHTSEKAKAPGRW